MNIEDLKPEILAFESMLPELIIHHAGKYVVIKNQKLIGAFDTFDSAAREAVKLFGYDHYLIKEVKQSNVMIMPASVAYRTVHANC